MWVERGYERVGDGLAEDGDLLALELPADRRGIPVTPVLVGGRYAVTPAKRGKMSRP